MNKRQSMVLKIIGASLAFAAVICLLIGGWHDLSVEIQRYEEAAGPEIRLRVRRLRRRRALRVIQSIKRTPYPDGWGPFFSARFFRHRATKNGWKKSPTATKFPLTEEKNHGKIRRLYDGRGYSAIFYR